MRALTRILTSAVAATVATVVVAAAPASASTVGVGTTNTQTSVLKFLLGSNGSVLNLGLLTDLGGANIDPHAGTTQAATQLVPITLVSDLLKLNLSTPPLATRSPGGSPDAAGTALTLSSLGVPAALATATIKPAALHSDFTAGAAHSGITAAEVDNLTLAGGALASIDLLSSNLGAEALTGQADGARGVKIGNIKLLDLGAVIGGLGMQLTSLPLATVSQLVSQLKLPVAGMATGSSFSDQVTSLSTALTGLRTTLVGATTNVTKPVDDATKQLLGGLGVPVPSVGDLVTTVNAEIASLQATLTGLLSSALSGLDSFPLVEVSGTQLGINTKAADTVANSAAGFTLAPLSIKVAGVQLPTLDLTAVTDTVNNTLGQANQALNSVLGPLHLPTNLVTLALLDKASSVTQNGDYTSATAGITMLTAKIAALDPSVITQALGALNGTPVSSLLNGSPLGAVLGASNNMGALGSVLGLAAPLLGGAQLQIASLAGASTYTFSPPPAVVTPNSPPPPPVILPHTGGNPELAIIGVILAALAVGFIRWARVSRSQTVTND